MKRLRILVMMHEDLVPPDSLKGHSESEIAQWRTEFDVVSALRKMRHEVRPLGVHDDLGVIRQAIADWKPDITFNLLEEFHGNSVFDYHVVGFLELMKQAYTGCNPRGLLLAHDKGLAKKILSYHRIRTPRFAVIPRRAPIRLPRRLRFPLFVKSLIEEGSYGIAHASIAHTEEKFRERVEYLQEKLDTPVIAEEYVEGRELYLAVLGNRRLQALPVIELQFGKLPEDAPRIATHKVKWDPRYQKEYGIDIKRADLEPRQVQALQKLARRVYRTLDLSGYARIDFRLAENGEIFVLEANANPDVAAEGELAVAARAAGMEYPALLERLLKLGLSYKPESRGR
ncbi:MAG TPA: D-alanine--D-alanine ligase [Gammaproteobacteria bacterium]|jgi:D-alanine-D-alanine ligase